MQDLIDIIREILSYRDFGFKPSDDAIMNVAQKIFLKNCEQYGNKVEFNSSKEKASEQQIWRLKKEGFKGDFDKITKMEASQEISDIEVKKVKEAEENAI